MLFSIRHLTLASCALFVGMDTSVSVSGAPFPSFRASETFATPVRDFSSWMNNHSQKTLQQLVIPGSHDAAAFKTQDSLPLFINRWVLTQEHSILEQLESGVRFLDIRLTYRNGELWTAHRFHTASFAEVSEDVLRFVTTNPSEVVIIKLQADSHIDDTIRTLFDQSGDEARKTMAPFLKALSDIAVPPSMARSTLKEMTSAGMNVVLLEGEGRSIPRGGAMWPWSLMSTRWNNAQWGASLCQGLVKNTEWIREDTLNLYQIQITPSSETILQGSGALVFGDLKGAAEHVAETVLLPFLETLDGSFSGIIGHDFVGDEKVMSEIISVNSRPVEQKNLITDAINAMKICQSGSCFDDDDCKGLSNSRCETAMGPERFTCASPKALSFTPTMPARAPFFRGFRFGPP